MALSNSNINLRKYFAPLQSNMINSALQMEPKKTNRFIVKFEAPFDISTWVVNYVSPLEFDGEKLEWKPIYFELYDALGPSTLQKVINSIENIKKLYELMKWDFVSVRIIFIDPVGDPSNMINITGKLTKIVTSELSWELDELYKIQIHLDIKSISNG